MTALVRLLLLCVVTAPALGAEADIGQARKDWGKLDRPGRIVLLRTLAQDPGPQLVAACTKWLKDKDPVVQGHVAQTLAACALAKPRLGSRVTAALKKHIASHLDVLTKRAKKEFIAVCRKHGREVPSGDVMAAGRNWEDPYDPKRRKLPPEVLAEREHMRLLLGGLAKASLYPLRGSLARVLAEHPDPEVVVHAIGVVRLWKDWRLLALVQDLYRPQEHGRELGGGDVIGRERYETLRLKWDVHKDRLWWSRPEYMPRIARSARAAFHAVTGVEATSAAEIDRWLLANEELLGKNGVKLTASFRQRARKTG